MAYGPSYFIFTRNHFLFLCENLDSYAYKWKEIGYVLKFRPQDIKNIESSVALLPSAPSSYLQQLLEEWIEEKYMHTVSPTLENLVDALNSQMVGLGRLATRLRKQIHQYEQTDPKNVINIASVSAEGEITFSRREAVLVAEKKSVTFKITTSSNNFRWIEKYSANAEPVYSNANAPKFYIPKANIDIDGRSYWCEIVQENGSILETEPITLRVSCDQLDRHKDGISSIYMHEVPEVLWPPIQYKTHINLAVIKQSCSNFGKEYSRLTIEGDLEDDLTDRDMIEYEEVFNGLTCGSLLLIEGRPGSGKTTFLHKIAHDWAQNEVIGPRRLLLLVSLRILSNMKEDITLRDILKIFELESLEGLLKERQGKGVCFIFDGLDEFTTVDRKQSLIYRIINKKVLSESMVVVASRPASLVSIRNKSNKIIEVIGFKKDQIYEYIEKYPFKQDDHRAVKVNRLKDYFNNHPNILHMCYLPIHTAMVLYLYQVTGKVPRTECEMYAHITRFMLIHGLLKEHDEEDVENVYVDNLNVEERETFKYICKVAFEKTIRKKQVLDGEDITVNIKSDDKKKISLGLITVDRTSGLYGFKNVYTFVHLTYQEYLAACHISAQSHEDQHELIEESKNKDHMQNVWKFYCGLVKLSEYKYQVKALFSGRDRILISDIRCAYESQQKEFCDFLMDQMQGCIVMNNQYISTVDFTALGYFMANSLHLASLTIVNCKIEMEGVRALLSEAESRPLLIHTFKYESENLQLESIVTLLAQQKTLKSLSLRKIVTSFDRALANSQTALEDFCFYDIIQSSLTNLIELDIDKILIGDKIISCLLQCCTKLKTVNLIHSIKEEDLELLLSGIVQCESLVELSCKTDEAFLLITHKSAYQFNQVFIRGSSQYGSNRTLIFNGNVKELHLEHFFRYFRNILVLRLHIPVTQVKRPITCIKDLNFSTVEKLALCKMKLEDNEANNLAEILRLCVPLQDFHFGNNTLSTQGISTLFASLELCSSLQSLVLNGTTMKTAGAHHLASCFQHWPNLQQLHLRECSINDDGAAAIIEALKSSRRAYKLAPALEFTGNPVSDGTNKAVTSLKYQTNDQETETEKDVNSCNII